MKRRITVSEAAELLGRPARTVRYWCERGILPAERIGGLWMIRTTVMKRRYPGTAEDLQAAAQE